MSEIVEIFLDKEFKSLYSNLLKKIYFKEFSIEYPKGLKSEFLTRMNSIARKHESEIEWIKLMSSLQYLDIDGIRNVELHPQIHFGGNAYSGIIEFKGVYSHYTNQLSIRLKRIRRLKTLSREEKRKLLKLGFISLDDSLVKMSLENKRLRILEVLRMMGYSVEKRGESVRAEKPKLRIDIKPYSDTSEIYLFGSDTFKKNSAETLEILSIFLS